MITPHDATDRVDHNRTIPTARVVAYFRSFSDIPYAKQTSVALRGEQTAREIYDDLLAVMTIFGGPFFEARYNCFNRFIDVRDNILELSVGTSVGRGLSISEDPRKFYIGTDLPEMIDESRAFFREIDGRIRGNHYLEPANVLSYDELIAAARHLGSRREMVIMNEGLWTYLTTEEQIVAADNIRRLLERYGGEWVTPDIWDLESNEQFISSLGPELRSAMPIIVQRASNLTGRDLEENYFADRHQAIRFFQRAGFEVEQHPMIEDLRNLTSITKLWGERERSIYGPALQQQRVWVMSLR
jgi:hypothetical protein